MNKYSKLLTALFLTQGIVLTGCGGDEDGDNGSSSSASSEQSSSAASVESSSSESSSEASSAASSVEASSSSTSSIVASSSSSVASSAPTSSSSSSAPMAETNWSLVWEDNFDGDSIDTSKWSHEVDCSGGGNNEWQCYTDSAENSYVEDGKLHIVARQVGGGMADDAYTSARLRTINKGDWKYGRIEARALMPQGRGIWPAIWMLPTDWTYGQWPLSGEIDIFEAVNPGTDHPQGGNMVHGTTHFGEAWPNNKHVGTYTIPEANIWEEYHTYAIEWEEGEIRWYVDDVHFATQTSDGWYNYYYGGQEVGFKVGDGAAPFDERFHLLLNVAVGGNWPGYPDVSTTFPQQMVVDYVRVYECSLDPETGHGCDGNEDPSVTPLPGIPAPTQETFMLYDDAPATVELAEGINATLDIAAYNPGGAIVQDGAAMDGDDVVWDINLGGEGNVSLTVAGVTGEGVDPGMKLTNMTTYGEVKFDLKVVSAEPDTQLLVKVDSGWPNLNLKAVELPESSDWTTVSVPFTDMIANDVQPGSLNYGSVINPVVFEARGGTAHIQVDDIRFTCLGNCGPDPIYQGVSDAPAADFDIIVDAEAGVNWDHGIDKWDNSSNSVVITTEEDTERGPVTNVSFSGEQNGLMFVQATTKKDLSAFVGNESYLTFDIKVESYGSNTTGIVVKMESGPGVGTGNLVIASPDVGTWTTVQVPIDDMVYHTGTNAAFDITATNTPFAILPVWDDQAGVEFQLDNVRFIKGEGEGGNPGPVTPDPVTDPTVAVYTDAFSADWAGLNIGQYDAPNSGGITTSQVAAAEADHGQVVQIEFGADGDWNSTIFIQSSTTKNLTEFSDGNLVFDIKVVNAGASTGAFLIKGEGGGSTGPGTESSITVDTDGSWHTMAVPVSALKIPNLAAVNVPISIWPVGGTQDGVIFQLDNIHWEQAADAP